MDTANNRKLNYIDYLTSISCLGVVYLHANGVFWSRPFGTLWVSANIIESLFYFSAPVFFMISGATLIPYRERYDTKTMLKRRLRRTVVPFFAWSVIWFLFNHRGIFLTTQSIGLLDLIKLPHHIVTCRIQHYYWFFIPLFMWYLSLPLFSLLHKRQNICKYLIAIAFCFESVMPFVSKLFSISMPEAQFYGLPGVTILMLVGYYLSQYEVRHLYFVYSLGFISLVCHCVGTILCSGTTVNSFLKGYTTPLCILYSSTVFLLVKNFTLHGNWRIIEFIVRLIRAESLGIYLMHGFFVCFLAERIGINTSSLLYRVFAPIAICIICAYISRLFRRFGLRWLV